ncbi:hypothetical protein [Chlorobium phaeobacteroides]|nr:hypothetical protein [Chlorobium phaeobacteroides]
MTWLKIIGAVVLLWTLTNFFLRYYEYSVFIYLFRFLGNYRQIAHIFIRTDYWGDHREGNRREEYAALRRHEIAERFLIKGGSKAVTGILAELKKTNNEYIRTHLAELIIKIGDTKALPDIEELFNRGAFHSSYGPGGSPIEQFLQSNSPSYRQKRNKEEEESSAKLVQATDMVKDLSDDQMMDILKRLCRAYSVNDESEIKNIEPIAIAIGRKLNQRGGLKAMRELYDKIGNIKGTRSLDMHWNGIGDWQG